jgi:hypothetical protein
LTARMHVSRGGQMAAYGDDLDQRPSARSTLARARVCAVGTRRKTRRWRRSILAPGRRL